MISPFEILKQNPKFIDEVPHDFYCLICKKVLIDAHCTPCGCQFCGSCIEFHITNGKKSCPGGTTFCNSEVLDGTNVVKSPFINRKIQRMRIECINEECDFVGLIADMAEHIRTCDFGYVDCDYREMGCVVANMTKKKMKNHIVDAALEHSALLAAWAAQMRNGMDQGARESQAEREKWQEENTALRTEVDSNKAKTETNEKLLEELLPSLSAQVTFFQFVWKISDLPQKRIEAQNGGAQSILSEEFYSHHKGYKMRLEAFPNGNNDGRGSHFSVHFVIVKGPHDEELQWPFNRNVIMLLASDMDEEKLKKQKWNYKKIKEKEPEKVDTVLDRPTEERNPGYGKDTFVNWDTLNGDDKFGQNGSIFVECLVQKKSLVFTM